MRTICLVLLKYKKSEDSTLVSSNGKKESKMTGNQEKNKNQDGTAYLQRDDGRIIR